MNKTLAWIVVVIIVIAGVVLYIRADRDDVHTEEYNPSINPADFSTTINNPLFSLTPGKKMTYEAETSDGIEKIEVFVTDETKEVMGVNTVVVWDRVWLDGELKEDTRDWFAQDNEGNVWYFGEETAEYEDGEVTTRAGSWEAGIDGAKPGIIMKAHPAVNETYRQEYYKGEAEDMATVLALGETVEVPFRTLHNCLQTLDFTPLEPDAKEHKFYCPEVAGVALEVDLGDGERVELISVEYNAEPSPLDATKEPSTSSPSTTPPPTQTPPPGQPQRISETEARAIALQRVPGTVTDVSIEQKFGKQTYVVEVDPSSGGPETDVIIDIYTGEVLGTET